MTPDQLWANVWVAGIPIVAIVTLTILREPNRRTETATVAAACAASLIWPLFVPLWILYYLRSQ